jgi:hypothetical protein
LDSLRCQSAFDDGYTPPADSPDTLSGWKIVAGAEIRADYYATLFGRTPIAMKRTSDGFKIACAGYQKEFDSTGLRCCSDKCERTRTRGQHCADGGGGREALDEAQVCCVWLRQHDPEMAQRTQGVGRHPVLLAVLPETRQKARWTECRS